MLLVDSGNALVVAELKVVEDDSMLVQGIDYYDFVSRHTEGMCRIYKQFKPDATQPVRLFLVAPSFSVTLLNRCKWIDAPISLFSYKCIRLEGTDETTPVFSEVNIPSVPKAVRASKMEDVLGYVTDAEARSRLDSLLARIKAWEPGKITAEPTKSDVSLKVGGRVFAYIGPRRKHFVVYTYDSDGTWAGYPVNNEEDIEQVDPVVRSNVERLGR